MTTRVPAHTVMGEAEDRGMFSFITVMGLEATCLLQAPEVIIKRDQIK